MIIVLEMSCVRLRQVADACTEVISQVINEHSRGSFRSVAALAGILCMSDQLSAGVINTR